MNEDEKWMQIAISEANLAKSKDEIPVGAVLIQNSELIAQAHNQPISHNDPTAHAEIQVLRIAAKQQSNYRLVGSTIYVTLEPCAMCLGAMMHARIKRIVFGASDPKTGVCGSCANLTSEVFSTIGLKHLEVYWKKRVRKYYNLFLSYVEKKKLKRITK